MSDANVLGGIPIIDVDTHYNEPLDLWTSRAPAKLRDRVPRVESVNGSDQWVIERDTVLYPHPGGVIRPDGSKLYGRMSLSEFDEMHPGATDPAHGLRGSPEVDLRARGSRLTLGELPRFAERRRLGEESQALPVVLLSDASRHPAQAHPGARRTGRLPQNPLLAVGPHPGDAGKQASASGTCSRAQPGRSSSGSAT